MKLYCVYSGHNFIGSFTALGPEDAITKAKEAIERGLSPAPANTRARFRAVEMER